MPHSNASAESLIPAICPNWVAMAWMGLAILSLRTIENNLINISLLDTLPLLRSVIASNMLNSIEKGNSPCMDSNTISSVILVDHEVSKAYCSIAVFIIPP